MPEVSLGQPIELTLLSGEQAFVPLAGAGSVGYAWSWEVAGDRDAVKIALESGATPAAGTGYAATSTPGGGSRPHTLAIRGLHPGTATVHLSLARSFEPDRPPRESLTITVRVVPCQSA
jgi:predicted secreted protein